MCALTGRARTNQRKQVHRPERCENSWLAETKQPEGDLGPEGCENSWLAETKQPEGDLGPEGCEVWCARQDSNLWPSAPEADALSS
jgi:hypothetical protein